MRVPRSCHARSRNALTIAFVIVTLVAIGCRSQGVFDTPPVQDFPATRQIERASILYDAAMDAAMDAAIPVAEPLTIDTQNDPQNWLLSLEDVIKITLENSDVIRDIGGRVVTGPQGTPTVYDPALQEVNPNSGVEAALSDYDARVASNLIFNRDERAFNNAFFGGGATTLHSNTANYNVEVSKTAVTGTRFAVRNVTGYNRNSSFANLFRSAYDTSVEAEFAHPLLQGSGIAFNRIAGPNSQAGGYNGVVLARIRTDIALADFEASVRNLVLNVENAYWQLYFAYRTLDARRAAYDSALVSWRDVQNGVELGSADGEAEALARANYYQARAALRNALSGGAGGTGVQAAIGVYSTERDLRLLMGIPANDGNLIRPSDEPSSARTVFDWPESLDLALDRRVELRRQRWIVKQRENELLAARHFLLSRLDLVGLYRWRGFGDDLLGNRDVLNGSAFSSLYAGDLQGWQLGLQYSATIGKRREHAALRSAQLQLAREKALLRNQELTITNDLSGQFADMIRTYDVAQDNYNVSVAQRKRLETATAKYDEGEELLVFVLEAQLNAADADSQFYRSLTDYNMTIANLHYARGTYLDYMGVHLSEGPWSPDAYRSYRKEFRRFKPRMNYCMTEPCPVSGGVYSQTPPPRIQPYFDEGLGTPVPLAIDPSHEIVVPGEAPIPPFRGLSQSFADPANINALSSPPVPFDPATILRFPEPID